MEETVEQQYPVRHLGIFRSVTIREARIDGCVLRTLFRKDYRNDGVGEGFLSNHIGKRVNDPTWIASIARLQEWRMIEVLPGYHGDARRLALTEKGKSWAIELIGDLRLAGKSPDLIEE